MKPSSSLTLLCTAAVATIIHGQPHLPLPPSIIVGYQSWSECDDNVYTAVENGVNVVIWFAVGMGVDPANNNTAYIGGGPNLTCVDEKISKLNSMGFDRSKIKHLVSVGGWDSGHPDTQFSADEYYAAWLIFNQPLSNNPNELLFDGFDWDLEGNDDLQSPINYYTKECLVLMAEFSNVLHNNGFIVSMAPPESYLDLQTTEFSKFVNLTYPDDDWNIDPAFSYHGRNNYAYVLAKYPDAIDFISFQLYETKSHADYNTTILGTNQATYLHGYLSRLLTEGISVDFTTDEDFNDMGVVKMDLEDKIVVGLIQNGGKGGPITAANSSIAYTQLQKDGFGEFPIRGFMYWCIADNADAMLAHDLNEFLNIV